MDQKRYLEALDGIITEANLETIKAWIALEVMWSFADKLSEELETTAFAFQSVLEGVPEPAPLEERVLIDINEMVGDAVGQLYVAEYFPPEAKAQFQALVEAILVAFRARLEANTWMSAETKAIALDKLEQDGGEGGATRTRGRATRRSRLPTRTWAAS